MQKIIRHYNCIDRKDILNAYVTKPLDKIKISRGFVLLIRSNESNPTKSPPCPKSVYSSELASGSFEEENVTVWTSGLVCSIKPLVFFLCTDFSDFGSVR